LEIHHEDGELEVALVIQHLMDVACGGSGSVNDLLDEEVIGAGVGGNGALRERKRERERERRRRGERKSEGKPSENLIR